MFSECFLFGLFADRINDLSVTVSAENPVTHSTTQHVCLYVHGIWNRTILGNTHRFRCHYGPLLGRYVLVDNTDDYLILCEVAVFVEN